MKAAVYNNYGGPGVLQINDIKKPVPGENEILIEVKATTVTPGDCVMRKGDPYASRLISGLSKPKNPILGHEFSGIVVETGNKVSKFKVGDKIFGSLGLKSGAYAEHLVAHEDANFQVIPEGMGFNEAAAVPVGSMSALFFLQKGKISSGQKVLINGASGSIGTYAVQLAKYYGAEVTALCSTQNFEMVKALGAKYVIDYKTIDYSTLNEQYDLIFDTVGKLSYNKCKISLKDKGLFVTTAVKASLLMQMAQANLSKKKKIYLGILKEKHEDLAFISDLLKVGKIRPVIDSIFPLEEISKAHEYVDNGHKKGNLVISIN